MRMLYQQPKAIHIPRRMQYEHCDKLADDLQEKEQGLGHLKVLLDADSSSEDSQEPHSYAQGGL
jgi:hypothetical protein